MNQRKNRTKVSAEPGKQELTITREFDAQRKRVFNAFVDPKLYSQWVLGPKSSGLTMTLHEFQPRRGGAWRYTQRDRQGNEYGFHGSYHEVKEPEMIIDTFEFEGLSENGHVSLETARFEELPDGRTRLTIHSVYQSVADRDGMLSSGMEEGVSDSFDRLEDVLSSHSPSS